MAMHGYALLFAAGATPDVLIAPAEAIEELAVKGVAIVGPLPEPLQKRTTYSAMLARQPRHPAEARALLEYLASSAGRQAFARHGFAAPEATRH